MPTENPNETIVPGKMRSDREEIPGGYTKEQADNAEMKEARTQREERERTARAGRFGVPPPGCQQYWPTEWNVCGAIRDKYNSLGGPLSFLFLPTSHELTSPDGHGKFTTFANGPIYWSAAGGAHPVVNSILNRWGVHGYEMSFLGYPTTDEIVNADGVGRRQEFQGAAIYWHPVQNLASSVIGGAIRDKWNAAGAETGPLGYPSSDEIPVTKNNGRYNNFVNGTITWSGPTGARLLYGLIRDRWTQFGREDGEMGYPIADEQVAGDGIGHFANFEDNSAVYSLAPLGAWRVPETLFNVWGSEGYEGGFLGYPVEAAINSMLMPGVTMSQKFEHGTIAYTDDDTALIGVYRP